MKTICQLALILSFISNIPAGAETEPLSAPVASTSTTTPIPNPMLTAGYEQLRAGAYKKASASFTAALKQDQKSLLARRYLCYTFLQLGETKKASAELANLNKLTKPTAFDLYLWGEIYLANGENKKAENSFRQSYTLDPTSILTEAGIVRSMAANGNYADAQQLCVKHIQSNEAPLVRAYFAKLSQNIQKLSTPEQPQGSDSQTPNETPKDQSGSPVSPKA